MLTYWVSFNRNVDVIHSWVNCHVQRKDYTALTKFLPPKHEYVISVRLSKVQIELYEKYLSRLSSNVGDLSGMTLGGSRIFTDYQNLMKIWTHPWVLKMDEIRQEMKVFSVVVLFSLPIMWHTLLYLLGYSCSLRLTFSVMVHFGDVSSVLLSLSYVQLLLFSHVIYVCNAPLILVSTCEPVAA